MIKIISIVLSVCILNGCSVMWRANQSYVHEPGEPYDNCDTIMAPAVLDGLALMGSIITLVVLNGSVYDNLPDGQHPIPLYNSLGLISVALSGLGLFMAHENDKVCTE